MDYTTRTTCRLCHSPNLVEVIDLGDQMIQHAFIHEGKKSPSRSKYPTILMRCAQEDCGLVQLKHSIWREPRDSTTATSPSSDDILMCCTFSRPVPPQVFTHWKLPLESNLRRALSLPPVEVAYDVAAPGSKSTVLWNLDPA